MAIFNLSFAYPVVIHQSLGLIDKEEDEGEEVEEEEDSTSPVIKKE